MKLFKGSKVEIRFYFFSILIHLPMFDQKEIFKIQSIEGFERYALQIFRWQAKYNKVYSDFLKLINKKVETVHSIQEIPFLPIAFFKNHQVVSGSTSTKLVFKSSGTTNANRSVHYLTNPGIYLDSFSKSYRMHVGDPKDHVIVALLPNYIEQGDSSLVYMVNELIRQTNNHLSQFVLSNLSMVQEIFEKTSLQKKQLVLFGVSYSLMDLCDLSLDLNGVWIVETGGMKGRREEISKDILHNKIRIALNPHKIFSEYGMTEMCSQAYSINDDLFQTPNWMKVYVSEVDDPFSDHIENKKGRLNIVDLANLYSCSFIQTDDLGIKHNDGFKLLGRIQNSDIRGCNQLVG